MRKLFEELYKNSLSEGNSKVLNEIQWPVAKRKSWEKMLPDHYNPTIELAADLAHSWASKNLKGIKWTMNSVNDTEGTVRVDFSLPEIKTWISLNFEYSSRPTYKSGEGMDYSKAKFHAIPKVVEVSYPKDEAHGVGPQASKDLAQFLQILKRMKSWSRQGF